MTSEEGPLRDWGERDPRWRGIRTEWIDVKGHDVRTLRVDGPEDGIPQLLVHGLGGACVNWLEVMVELSAYGPVVAPDLPGFGETPPPRDGAASIEANVAFVAALCRRLGWDRVVLHGNSMGGLISVLVAGERPQLIERLVLVNPGLPAPARTLHRIPKGAFVAFAAFVVPGLGDWLFRRRYARNTAEDLYAETLELVYAEPERVRDVVREVSLENVRRGKELDWRVPSFVHAAESLVGLLATRVRVRRAVHAVEAPTLVIWGDSDRLVGQNVIDGLTARRPDWTFEVFDNVGHAPMLETPDRHLAAVGRWLETTGVPRRGDVTGASV